jgi:hypothetical protein
MPLRIVRRLASWFALVAILAVTFMPTLTMAFADARSSQDVCSADPSRTSGGDRHHALAHCPYCALHAEVTLPPLPPGTAAGAAVLFRELPAAFLNAPRASGVWSTSQPRAPPAFA